ncbi:MAG: heavy metal-binding domain-containing protein [Pyrinomonadaceae bacterium]
MKKNLALPLAFSLAALTLTISPSSSVRASHAHKERTQAESGARRRPAKRRKSTPQQEATYTCPMHKDVHTKSPGECPKCKMELELEKPGKAKSE